MAYVTLRPIDADRAAQVGLRGADRHHMHRRPAPASLAKLGGLALMLAGAGLAAIGPLDLVSTEAGRATSPAADRRTDSVRQARPELPGATDVLAPDTVATDDAEMSDVTSAGPGSAEILADPEAPLDASRVVAMAGRGVEAGWQGPTAVRLFAIEGQGVAGSTAPAAGVASQIICVEVMHVVDDTLTEADIGCGPVSVAVDEALESARISGTVASERYAATGGTVQPQRLGWSTITVDIEVLSAGPAELLPSQGTSFDPVAGYPAATDTNVVKLRARTATTSGFVRSAALGAVSATAEASLFEGTFRRASLGAT